MDTVLDAGTLAHLRRLRLRQRGRVQGRFAGAHKARGHGASLDFADYREYVAGDDPRRVDVHAYARLGKRLVKLYEAEDEAALRIVVDLSASMGFGRKAAAAREAAAVLAVVTAVGGDRARVVLAHDGIDVGPWFRGSASLPWVQQRLADAEPAGVADLPAAVLRAVREGPVGPVALVSDLLDEAWASALNALAVNRADTTLIHVVGRDDLQPSLDGDVRVIDSERDDELEVGMAEATLTAYAQTRDRWLDDIDRACRSSGIASIRFVDDEDVGTLIGRLVKAGVLES